MNVVLARKGGALQGRQREETYNLSSSAYDIFERVRTKGLLSARARDISPVSRNCPPKEAFPAQLPTRKQDAV